MLSRCPWGRNECVTNKLQRASAGRLMCGMLPKSIDRKRCIYNLKAVLGDLRSEGNKLQCRQKVLKFWHFPTQRIPMLQICQHSNPSLHPVLHPHPPQINNQCWHSGTKMVYLDFNIVFWGGKGRVFIMSSALKSCILKLDLQYALIFSWHFIQDYSLFKACQVISLVSHFSVLMVTPKCWYKVSTT